MNELINSFPRQIGFPDRKLIQNESDFYKEVNKNNGVKNLYYSLYRFEEGRWWDFNKLFLDFDGEKAFEDMKTLHKFLGNEYKHLILFSGKKGYHIYIFLTNYEMLKDAKSALRNCAEYFKNELKIVPDESTFGDVARIARIPNTFHITGKRYCIPLSDYDIKQGEQHIKDKAKEQNFQFTYFGEKLFDISKFDYLSPHYKNIFHDYPELKQEIKVDDKLIKKFPKIFQVMLLYPVRATYDARFAFGIYCKEIGLHPDICKEIAKKYWSGIKERNGRRSKYEEFKVEVLPYVYKREYFLPNWIMQTLSLEEKKKIYKEMK